ncbi:MAG: DegV family protein, partial [Erysipelotrichaceae bacterium]
MKRVAIMSDSSADISALDAKRLNIHIVRMPIIVDGKEYKEEIDIDAQTIIDKMRTGSIVKTAQPVLGDMFNMWDELLLEYDEVFYLPLARALSGTCAIAIETAKNYDGRVIVVDSNYVSCPMIVMLEMVADMLSKGYTSLECKSMLENDSYLLAILIPENLTTLKNGGRISPAAASLAGLLKIVPLLKVDHGAIDIVTKVRTLSKAYKTGIEYITKDIDPADYIWMIIDADNPSASAILKEQLESVVKQPVLVRNFRAVITSHTGPGTIGFGRIKKIKY